MHIKNELLTGKTMQWYSGSILQTDWHMSSHQERLQGYEWIDAFLKAKAQRKPMESLQDNHVITRNDVILTSQCFLFLRWLDLERSREPRELNIWSPIFFWNYWVIFDYNNDVLDLVTWLNQENKSRGECALFLYLD